MGCSFRITPGVASDGATNGPPGEGVPDAAIDAGPVLPGLCDPATGLLVCFTFDAPTLTNPLANEGSAAVSAQHSGVTRIARGSGGAASVDTSSQIRIPPGPMVTGVAAMEVWVKIDVAPPVGSRVGITDADATSSAMSFFYYDGSPSRQLRFELGQQMFLDRVLTLGTWYYLAQVCYNNVLTAYIDGVVLGTRAGCTPGNATPYGLQLGQNNTQTGGDQGMTGAIDGVRMWTTPRTPQQICEAAGLSGC